MHFFNNYIHKLQYAAISVLALGALSACSLVQDDLPECEREYRLKFTYTMNMAYADAFANQVNSVELYAFDKNDNDRCIVFPSISLEELQSQENSIELNLAPGNYDFIAWCGIKSGKHYAKAQQNPNAKEHLALSLISKSEAQSLYHDEDLENLFHGSLSNVKIEELPLGGKQIITMDLVKNTNRVNVLLQHLDGTPIAEDDFDFYIESDNNDMDYDNSLLSTGAIRYKSWNKTAGSFSRADEPQADFLLGEMTTNRLVKDNGSRLVIKRNEDNTEIININLEKYLLLIKGNSGNMSDQEFLDRQDLYAFQFFLDQNNNWYIAGGIFINNWRVVPPQEY